MRISEANHTKRRGTIAALQHDRRPWWEHWRELADFFLPRRYIWLQTENERRRIQSKSPFVLDGTGTSAARTLASGMMNGITSPSRPWFKLTVPGVGEELSKPARVWLDAVEREMMATMAQTNFYNSMAVVYLDLVIFGTAANLIYEDFESVFRCYNAALGEYYVAQDDRMMVNTFAREFTLKVHQVVERWGEENCSTTVKDAWKAGGARLQEDVKITHLIEPNVGESSVIKRFPFRETYWETAGQLGEVLEERGFFELPGVFPRWELVANDAYGSSPAMDALPDVIQLQHETKKKAQSLDKLVDPPVIADIQLQHRPTALLPRGVTYVAGVNNVGVKPAYTVNPPLDAMTMDIREMQARIRETFHNDLFKMISQLDTVRSATEIDARREEKLVLLGPVLERFENEALDPAIKRIFAIMERAKLLPEAPPELSGAQIEIQYVSILSSAQSAVGVVPIERWLQLVGNVSALTPEVLQIPDWNELIRDYGQNIGVKAKLMRSPEEVQADQAAQKQAQALRESLEVGEVGANAAETLSKTDVGGGQNALQKMIGG